MDKYKCFTTMTKDCLGGDLVNLIMNYEDDSVCHITISYEANRYFTLDYEFEVNTLKKQLKFLSHGSNKVFEKIRLSRDEKFESAVKEYFFH